MRKPASRHRAPFLDVVSGPGWKWYRQADDCHEADGVVQGIAA